jgi:RimJ/RimL family protein N-acetyltransferase
MVRGLVDWALGQEGVHRIASETGETNLASWRLLEKIGFVETGPGREPGDLHFEYPSPSVS